MWQIRKNHIIMEHEKEKQLHCYDCSYATSRFGNLNKHIRTIHKKEKFFQCTDCDYATSYKESLKRHVIKIHRKDECFKCIECDYSVSFEAGLKQHINLVHEKNKLFHCNSFLSQRPLILGVKYRGWSDRLRDGEGNVLVKSNVQKNFRTGRFLMPQTLIF